MGSDGTAEYNRTTSVAIKIYRQIELFVSHHTKVKEKTQTLVYDFGKRTLTFAFLKPELCISNTPYTFQESKRLNKLLLKGIFLHENLKINLLRLFCLLKIGAFSEMPLFLDDGGRDFSNMQQIRAIYIIASDYDTMNTYFFTQSRG